jgi:hypothetical protein
VNPQKRFDPMRDADRREQPAAFTPPRQQAKDVVVNRMKRDRRASRKMER